MNLEINMNYIEQSDFNIEHLNFSVRTYNCLKKSGINTLNELLDANDERLRKIKSLGEKSLSEIFNFIRMFNSGDFVLEVVPNNNEKLMKYHELKIIDFIKDNKNEHINVLFYNELGFYTTDKPIEELNLSIRSYNALSREGCNYVSQLLELNLDDFSKIRNLGEKSKNEIIDKLKETTKFIYNENAMNRNEKINDLVDYIINEHIQSMVEFDYNTVYFNTYKMLKENSDYFIENENKLVILDDIIVSKIYKNNYLLDLIRGHIVNFIFNNGQVNFSMIRNTLPKHLKDSVVIKDIIDNLVNSNKIVVDDGIYKILYPKIVDYVNSLGNRDKLILFNRLQGKTLEETGLELGITRERIRQLEKKAFEKIPKVKEDEYKEIFENYNWSIELFKYTYNEPDLVYGYLESKYNKGINAQEDILEDKTIPINIRLKVEKFIYKDYITISGLKIPKDRNEVLNYILRTYCREEVTSQELTELYYKFLYENGLQNNKNLSFPDRYFETTLANSKRVLWKHGKKLRYYDFSNIDSDTIVEALSLAQYENVEFSTLKFFNTYIDIMNEWDIRDEYELHNLMKKTFQDDNDLKIKMLRMPNIEFGEPDRDMQVLDLLLQAAPIDNYELAKLYENEFGVKAETALANYFKCINEYYYNGFYKIDSKALIGEEYEIMKDKLTKDYYFIKDVKNLYIKLFPEGNINIINPYNIKRLGFKINSSLIFSDKYVNSEHFFRNLILKDDIFDATILDPRLKSNQAYYHVMQVKQAQLDIIEFLPNRYINIKRLEQNGIIKEKLFHFINDVSNFVGNQIFTIKFIKSQGFENELFELGFDDMFYGSIVKSDSSFKSRRIGENLLIRRCDDVVLIDDLIEYIVYKRRSIDIYDLIEMLNEYYGVNVEKYKVSVISKEKGLYYDTIMEKVYIDYDEYFEEV
jgi:hypothetical protein